MTVIAVLKHPTEGIWLGSDSRAAGKDDAMPCATPKLGSFDGFSFGYCGSFRFGQVLLHAFRPPKHPKNVDTDDYMFTLWLESLREYMSEYGIVKSENGIESADDADCIIVYRDEVYLLQSDLSLLKPIEPYAAIGSGASYAIGALFALAGTEMPAQTRVEVAVECACLHCPQCGFPFRTLKHDPDSTPRQQPKPRKKKNGINPQQCSEIIKEIASEDHPESDL